MTAVFSSAVLMMGLSFVYGLSGGSLYYNDVAAAVANGEMSGMLIVALAFVLAGIGFKLSLVPFHLWTADVYQGAPTSVTSYLSVISKGSAAFAFFVIFVQAFGAVYPEAWEWMLYGIIILTITVGNLFAIRQKNMKRFMAFSSVSQAGYIMLGVIAANAIGMTSMLFYILVYIFSNLGAFGVIQAIGNKSGKLNMDDYKGLHKSNPWLAFAMTLAMFSPRRYSSLCWILLEDSDIHIRYRKQFDGSLYVGIDSVNQHYHLSLLLPACCKGNVDCSGRPCSACIPQCLQ